MGPAGVRNLGCGFLRCWLVDPGGVGQVDDLGAAAGGKPLGMSCAGLVEGGVAFGVSGRGEAVVDVGGGVQTDAGVAVVMVVAVEESVHELLRVGKRAEPFGER